MDRDQLLALLSAEEVLEMVEHSYELVVQGLPQRLRPPRGQT